MFKRIITLTLTFSFILLSTIVWGQDLLQGRDLSRVKVDQLSDADIQKYYQQLQSAGVSLEQAEQIAKTKRFPILEWEKLKQRLTAISASGAVPAGLSKGIVSASRIISSPGNPVVNNGAGPTSFQSAPDPLVFGSELFSTSSLSFQPDLRIATPVNYELGPDDELLISVYGLQEVSFNLTVSPEGSIYIPNVGMIKVAGETVDAATSRIRSRMAGIAYGSLRTGASKLSVSLGKIRSIRVTVLGAVKPGTYTVSSLSTLFNALYQAGGPSSNGSFREIELLRNNKVERKVDLYQFLLHGSQADNVRLRENDVIRIPVYDTRVEIAGEVRRPGLYELVGKESLSNLIQYASGFTDNAYRASIKVVQVTDKERRIKDLDAKAYAVYVPLAGDAFEVSRILNRFQNRVTISGAVFRPGVFELTPGLTVGALIRKAEGLREDAFTQRGQVSRLKTDLSTEIISFDLMDVLEEKNDVELRREDNVTVSSIFDLRDKHTITVQGEVRKPGTYNYMDSLTLKDIVLQAGGFSDAAYPQKIEIARMIRRDTLSSADARLSDIIEINSLNDLSLSSSNLPLQPFDVITIRRMPGYLSLQSVTASGQVQFPGPYVLSTRLERISDLMKRAGGLSPEAFADGAYLRRRNERTITTDIDQVKVEKIQEQLKDTTGALTNSIARPFDQIPLDLTIILANPGKEEDLVLKPGDELFIPRNDEEIAISGEILFPTQVPYRKSKSLKDYVSDAGGFTDNARKPKVYVLYPNGRAASTRNYLLFKSYPTIKPGTQIVVPKIVEKPRSNRSTAETIGIASAVASLAGVVIAIVNLIN